MDETPNYSPAEDKPRHNMRQDSPLPSTQKPLAKRILSNNV